MIYLQPLDANNWKLVVDLRLATEQIDFVPSNLYSAAAAQFYPDSRSRAIYSLSEGLVGYVLYGIDQTTGHWKVFRLMIDKRFQAKGYGKATMLVILEELKKENVEIVLLKYHKDNQAAHCLYKGLGFKELESTPTHITDQCLLD